MSDLASSGYWDWETLDRLLEELELPKRDDGGGRVKLERLPVERVAVLRRPRRSRLIDEERVRADVAQRMGCRADWNDIDAHARVQTWERYKRAKRAGGVRWIDIPPPRLKSALRIVHDVLLSVMPAQGTMTAFHAGASPALHARAHAGAAASVRVDIRDFFGSIRPRHVRPWFGVDTESSENVLPKWSELGRRVLCNLVFRHREGAPPYLPQGAPTSPLVANLAGLWLDRAVVHMSAESFGPGGFVYTRYADDLVLSTKAAPDAAAFLDRALSILEKAAHSQGWSLQPSKTRIWTERDPIPLHICGLRVPRRIDGPLTLDRPTWRRARAALHRLRHRRDFGANATGDPSVSHGLLAYAYSATGDLRWLAYTSTRLTYLARGLSGHLFSESFLAGWSDENEIAPPPGSG